MLHLKEEGLHRFHRIYRSFALEKSIANKLIGPIRQFFPRLTDMPNKRTFRDLTRELCVPVCLV
jgi:hypothetical protein